MRALALLAVGLASTGAAWTAGDTPEGFEAGVQLGMFFPDEDLAGVSSPDPEGVLGIRFGYVHNAHWGLFADLTHGDLDTETFAGDASMINLRGGIDYFFQKERANRFFATLGGGVENIQFEAAEEFRSAFVSAGFGQRIPISGHWRYRWELRADHSLAADGLRGEDLTQVFFTVGLVGGPTRYSQDLDQDGVRDVSDRCLDSPAGETVGPDGCPKDSDGDGVIDLSDRCPQTPAKTVVGMDGCRVGEDDDGVPFEKDECPNTPDGAKVDRRGCPVDGDLDGVFDGLDRCPRTLSGVEVGEDGCFLDADGDGIYDGLGMDRCPGTPKGVPVDQFGCPKKSS